MYSLPDAKWDVRVSDATLVLSAGAPTGGTKLIVEVCRRLGKPHLVVDLRGEADAGAAAEWIGGGGISTLNVTGPRASGAPGGHGKAGAFLFAVVALLADR